jgi:RNase P/RNase MRP subunit p29
VRIVLGALRRRVPVALLDEQPLVLAALRLDERPPAAQLVAAQLEQQLALVESRGDVVQWEPLAAVPDDDGARAVIVGRDHALEVDIVDGVILDVHGETLVGRVRRRTFRDAQDFSTPSNSSRKS